MNIILGERLEAEWTKIRKKYVSYHNKNRKTDADDLMSFLNPYLKTRVTKTAKKVKATQGILDNQLLNGQITDVEVMVNNSTSDTNSTNLESHIQSDIYADDDKYENLVDPAGGDLLLERFEDETENKNENNAQRTKPAKTPKNPIDPDDPFRLSIRKAFSSEIEEPFQLNAMVHLCQKISDFKLSRSVRN